MLQTALLVQHYCSWLLEAGLRQVSEMPCNTQGQYKVCCLIISRDSPCPHQIVSNYFNFTPFPWVGRRAHYIDEKGLHGLTLSAIFGELGNSLLRPSCRLKWGSLPWKLYIPPERPFWALLFPAALIRCPPSQAISNISWAPGLWSPLIAGLGCKCHATETRRKIALEP